MEIIKVLNLIKNIVKKEYEETDDIYEATHWIAKKDGRWKDKYTRCGVLENKSYQIHYINDIYEAPYIIDDFGRESYIFLAHDGVYVIQKSKKAINILEVC